MDGLILNTEDLYTVAFQNIVSRYGKHYTFDLKLKLMGSQSHETAQTIISELNLPMTVGEFLNESRKQFEVLFPETQLMPGARKLIEHLHTKNIPIGLATSSSRESYELKVNKHHQELFSLFPYKTMGSSDPDVKRGKPHPDIFLVAASRFPDKPKPEECLVFEDAVNGVKAARAADTEDLYSIGFQRVVSRFGKEFTFELKTKIMGSHSREFSATIINDLDLPMTVDEFIQETSKIFNELFPQTSVLPGVYKLIRHLHDHNIPMALATSSGKASYDLKTRNHQELFDLIPYKVWGSSDSDVKRGKPHPDIFFVAASKFPDKPAPEKCLVFEDSVNGVMAARAAGMQVVMVPDSRLDRSLTQEATIVLDSMEDFNPKDFGLPPL